MEVKFDNRAPGKRKQEAFNMRRYRKLLRIIGNRQNKNEDVKERSRESLVYRNISLREEQTGSAYI